MKYLKTTRVLVCFLGLASLTIQANAQSDATAELHQLYINTINTSNIKNIDALYTKDASIRNSDGSMISGVDNIKKQYAATFAVGEYNITLKSIDEALLGKDYMFVRGSFVYNKLNEPKMVLRGEFVNTLKRMDGHWKIYKSSRFLSATNNKAVVESLYNAFATGDIPAALDAMDAKIVWNEAEGNALAVGNPYIGPDAVLQGVFAKLPVDFDNFRLADIKLHEMSNDQVLATLRYNATSKHNGKTLDAQAAYLCTVKDGKLTAFQQYVDTKQLNEMMME